MKINFIGNFQNGYVGEVGDATHLARELENLGHEVQYVPQDIWKAYCDDLYEEAWAEKLPKEADFNIICKWHHFNNGKYIRLLQKYSKAPVFYWVWDLMGPDLPDWHIDMVKEADLYLGNDVRDPIYRKFKNAYYFPFDVADGDLPRYQLRTKKHEVTFFGSWVGKGDRQTWLKEINKTNPVTVYSWNYKDWPEEFTDVHEAVYGDEFARKVADSKIILGFSIEPNLWGYWSNRTGKILTQGGFLLYQYAPGMELFLRDGAEYFSTIEEAREKIDHYLVAETEREEIAKKGYQIGQHVFTSHRRVKDLTILMERYLATKGEGWIL